MQLRERLDKIMESHTEAGEEVSFRFALKELKRGLESEFGKGAMDMPQYVGFFLGAARLIDWMEIRRNKARKVWSEDPERAVEKKFTDRYGRPLDNRELLFGKENKKYGELLDPDYDPEYPDPSKLRHEYQRSLYGMFRLQNIPDEYKFYEFRVRGEQATDIEVRLLTPCSFRCDSFETKLGEKVLQPTSATKFLQLEGLPDGEEPENILHRNISLIPINELGQWYNARKDTYNRLLFVEGEVAIKRTYGDGQTFMGLTTADFDLNLKANVSCFVPGNVKTDFGIGSTVIVFGELGLDKNKQLAISTYGVFPRQVVREATVSQESGGIAWMD